MKRIVTALMVVLTICVMLSGCRPSEMDDRTYELGKDAVELAQDFLDGRVPAKEARDKMHDIYEKFDELDFGNKTSYKKEHHNSMVQIMVLGFTTDLLGTKTDYEMSKKVEADLKELKDYLGLK